MAGADLMGRDRDAGYFRVPRAVSGLVGTHVVSVHCGSNFTLAVDRDGVTHRWAKGTERQTPKRRKFPQQRNYVVRGQVNARIPPPSARSPLARLKRRIPSPPPVLFPLSCISTPRHARAFSFGWNEGDALGRGWEGTYDPSPGRVSSLPGVVSLAAGSRHGVAVSAEGPAVGLHLRSVVGNADSADVELLTPDAARRGEPGGSCSLDSSA